MTKLTSRSPKLRPSGGERVFTDDMGRLWSAAAVDEGRGVFVIFTCINDGRQASRAIVVDMSQEVRDVGDETLRAWLEAAPRIGRLT